MSRFIAIQMDPLEGINRHGDTTLLLGVEAARRGYEVYHYLPKDLSLCEGVLVARARKVTLSLEENYFSYAAFERIELAQAEAVLMRQDPPFNMEYITACHLLETLQGKTRVVNDPFHVRNNPEKIFPLQFPDFIPPTLMSADQQEIEDFRARHGAIVIKPLHGFGGHGVFLLQPNDVNASSLMELLLAEKMPVVAQRFLKEVESGERRVHLIGGKIEGVLARIPKAGEIRANLRVGGSGEKAELTKKQKEICAVVGPVLMKKNILFAGLDFIGDHLIEINITCPTGLRAIKALYGTSPEVKFWDAVEALG